MKWLYKLLDGLSFVNIPISLVLIYVARCTYKRIWNDYFIRGYRFTIVLFGLFLLIYESDEVTYANIVWNIDYRILLITMLIIAFLIMCLNTNLKNNISSFIKNINSFLNKENNDKEEIKHIKGFTCDNNTNKTISGEKNIYISVLAEKLLATNIEEHSFAVGLTGDWGVGKTTYLNLLKEEIKDKADVVEFNPWLCSTSHQVTHDFFNSLREKLSPKYSILSNTIKEYAKLLSNITISQNQTFAMEMIIPAKEESLYEQKNNLSKKFGELPRPVFMFIDDIDRLEREEVFEVLRLIRNTGDISNIVYVVAYDKQYVTCVLEEKNIKDAHSYLEKIFNVEVHIPKIEDEFIWTYLKTEIDKQDCTGKNFSQGLFKKFKYEDRELILNVLDNYRRTKRFARLYMFSVNYLFKSSYWGEIRLIDLFWLELLQTYDKQTYDVLSNDPDALLYKVEGRYKIKEGIKAKTTQEKDNVFKGSTFGKEKTPELLDKIFGDEIKTTKLSACQIENYEKYFTLSVLEFKLSIKEMKDLFKDEVNPEDKINEWLSNGKYLNSIMYQMKQVEMNNLDHSKLKIYLSALMYFAIRMVEHQRFEYVGEVKKLLQIDRCSGNTMPHDVVLEWIDNEINNGKILLPLSKLLNVLYVSKDYDENNNLVNYHELVISNEEIEERLKMLIEKFLENHLEFTAFDILNENTSLSDIFENCCVEVTSSIDCYSYKQVAFDSIIAHFEKKESKPTLDDFEVALSRWSRIDIPKEEYDYWDEIDMEYKYEEKMKAYFGDRYNEKLSEFKTKCLICAHN